MPLTVPPTFGNLGGAVADNAALVAALALKADLTDVVGLLDLKASLDASANPNYPSGSLKGDARFISVAGKVGGGSGKTVEVGDLLICLADNAGGTEASVGTSWSVIQNNLAGMTAAGLAMIQAADAAAQQVLLGITGGGAIALGGFTLTVPATGTAALRGTANDFTAAQTISVNGAASTPAQSITGTPFTGGSATTTKPLSLVETTGATSNNWNTSGTLAGFNAPSGFTGDLIVGQLNGAARFKVDSTGKLTFGSSGISGLNAMVLVHSGGTVSFGVTGGGDLLMSTGLVTGANAVIRWGFTGGTDPILTGTASTLTLTQANFVLGDGLNISGGSSTGMKLLTATTQKLGVWNATPIVQPTTAIAAATFVANTSLIADDSATFDGYTLGQVVKALRNIGLLA